MDVFTDGLKRKDEVVASSGTVPGSHGLLDGRTKYARQGARQRRERDPKRRRELLNEAQAVPPSAVCVVCTSCC
jgi:hypothetical protein